MAKRVKKTVIVGVTQEVAEQAMASFAMAEARKAKIKAEIDIQFTKIRDEYAAEQAELDEIINLSFDKLQVFATENPNLFKKKKRIDTAHGVFGYRTGQPKAKTLKGFTWAAVASVLQRMAPDYIRTSIEADKQKLIDDREKIGDKMADYGVEIVQDETFYVERKTEETTA